MPNQMVSSAQTISRLDRYEATMLVSIHGVRFGHTHRNYFKFSANPTSPKSAIQDKTSGC